MKKENKISIKYFDPILILTMLSLIFIGILFIYSGTRNIQSLHNKYINQLFFTLFGLLTSFVFIFFNYKKIGDISFVLYILLNILLLFTIVFGKRIHGAKSWIKFGSIGFQPSELGKLIFIIFLAKFISLYEKDKKYLSSFKFFITTGFLALIPAIFIVVQPDFGTMFIYFLIFIFLAFYSNMNTEFLLSILIIIIIGATIPTLRAYYNTIDIYIKIKNIIYSNIYFYFLSMIFFISSIIFLIIFLKFQSKTMKILTFVFASLGISFLLGIFLDSYFADYQKQRLLVFINPNFDKLGAGYNIIQSKIAIGSGGLFGKGLFKGTQSQFGFLPERTTDFIFSLICEETGFLGSFILLSIYSLMLGRLLWIAFKVKDLFGKLVTLGVFSYFFSQSTLNIGMTIGLMPITGVPLPFVSAGGSSLLTSIYSIMLVNSVYMYRYSA